MALGIFDIVIFGVIAAALVLRLWMVLGQKTDIDEERQRKNGDQFGKIIEMEKMRKANKSAKTKNILDQKTNNAKQAGKQNAGQHSKNKVITVSAKQKAESKKSRPTSSPISRMKVNLTNKSSKDAIFDHLLKLDPYFTEEIFLDGAGKAYSYILEAFGEGNKSMLKDLVSKEIYVAFSDSIDARKKANEVMTLSVLGVDSSTLLKTQYVDGQIIMGVQFNSSQIRATSHKGDVIEGDIKKAEATEDRWLFAKDAGSSDPNWILIGTEFK